MKLKVGCLGLGRSTFDTKLAEKNYKIICKKINSKFYNVIGAPEIIYDDETAAKSITFFKKNVCDYFIVIQTTFTDAKFIVQFARLFKDKFLLLAVQEKRTGSRLRLNSVCGLNLASHALQKNGFFPTLEIIDLNNKNFINDINIQSNKRKKSNLKTLKRITHNLALQKEIFNKVKDQTIGLIGKRPEGFYTCDFNTVELKQKLTLNVKSIKLDELFNVSKKTSQKEISLIKDQTKKYISGLDKLNKRELNKSLSLYNGLKLIKNNTKVDSLAVRCWPETFTKYGCGICGPMAMMNEELVSSACEADVLGSASSNVLTKIANSPSLLVDVVDVRKSDQTAVLWHCGLAPASMAEEKIRAGIHSNRKKPLLHEFALKKGEITIFRISKARNKLIFFVKKAKILKRKKSFSGTSGVVTFGLNTYQKFKQLFECGIEHHLSFTYGNYKKEIVLLGKKLKIPVYTI